MMPDRMGNDDEEFWQRFNVAASGIGMNDVESLGSTRLGTPFVERGDPTKDAAYVFTLYSGIHRVLTYWHSDALEKQKSKRRKTHWIVWGSGILIVAIIIAVAIVGWWFSQGPGNN